jgi:hypothetical protein
MHQAVRAACRPAAKQLGEWGGGETEWRGGGYTSPIQPHAPFSSVPEGSSRAVPLLATDEDMLARRPAQRAREKKREWLQVRQRNEDRLLVLRKSQHASGEPARASSWFDAPADVEPLVAVGRDFISDSPSRAAGPSNARGARPGSAAVKGRPSESQVMEAMHQVCKPKETLASGRKSLAILVQKRPATNKGMPLRFASATSCAR